MSFYVYLFFQKTSGMMMMMMMMMRCLILNKMPFVCCFFKGFLWFRGHKTCSYFIHFSMFGGEFTFAKCTEGNAYPGVKQLPSRFNCPGGGGGFYFSSKWITPPAECIPIIKCKLPLGVAVQHSKYVT